MLNEEIGTGRALDHKERYWFLEGLMMAFQIELSQYSFNSSVFLDEQYRKSMVQMILYGISEKTKVLSENQKRELNKLCIINPETMPPKNPLFNALSEVIRKKGFPGTTVESIADEMGLAKSSLYTYIRRQ